MSEKDDMAQALRELAERWISPMYKGMSTEDEFAVCEACSNDLKNVLAAHESRAQPDKTLIVNMDQAAGWRAVADTLTKVSPRWLRGEGTGIECAVAAIERLAQAQPASVADRLSATMQEAIAICDRDIPEIAGNGFPTAWGYVRAELLRLHDEVARLDRECRDRIRQALENGQAAQRVEAELAALKRSPQGTVQAVRPQADGCCMAEVRCDSAGVASLFLQRIALVVLP